MSCSKAVYFVVVLFGAFLGSLNAFADDVQGVMAPADNGLFSNNYDFSDSMLSSGDGSLDMFWKTRIYGEAVNMPTQSSEVGGADVNFKLKYTLVDTLDLRAFLRGKYEAGRSQSFLGDLAPSDGIFIREGAIRYYPFEFFEAKAGVIDQDWMEMPMLTYHQSFLGGVVDVHHTWNKEITAGLNAQQLIPGSQTLSSRTSNREATPSFQTQEAYFNWKNNTFNAFQSVGHFAYDKLPSQVAWDSSHLGNDYTLALSPLNSEFKYEFDGWFTQTALSYRLNSLMEPKAYLHMIKNNDAPEENSDGQLMGLGMNFHTNKYLVSVAAEHYYLESDTVPGFYNAWAYGHTNQEGNGGEISVAFLKYKFRIRAQYYNNKVIIYNNNQENSQYFYLGVETGYDKI